MADSMEEVNAGGKEKCRKWCVLRYISCGKFSQIVEFFGTSIASLDLETVQLPAFSMLSAMWLVPCSNVLRMIVTPS